jgi:3-oxoacyl-[acyl-carrier protein] reductase
MKALVVGGTSAIGEAIIKQLINNNYEVDFTYHSNAQKADEICTEFGPTCRCINLDLSSLDAIETFFGQLSAANAPDVLVNVAGITRDGLSIGDVKETLTSVHQVNFLAPALMSSKIAELMMQNRRGHIVNISSVAARIPRSGNAAYGSAKIALERYTATLALEIARFKVRTLCISPAFVDTPMYRKFAQGKEREILKSLPLREVLAVEDVANSVMAFVSNQVKTTGATLSLTNGQPSF